MTRNDAIEYIAEALLIMYGGDFDEREEVRNATKMDRLITAATALKAMEKIGMLPPRHYNVEEYLMEEPAQPGYHGLNGWEA